MSDLFFYGTLRHRPLLSLVLGRAPDDIDLSPASLPDHAVYGVQGHPFPMILPEPGSQSTGILARGLSADDINRLVFYEGGFDYELETRLLVLCDGTTAPAEVFIPEPDLWTPDAPWSLTDWAARWGRLSVYAAEEVMAFYGRVDPAQIVRSFPAIRGRAAARIDAERRAPDPERDVCRDIDVQRHHRAYVNYFGMSEMDLRHRRNDGSMSDTLNRGGLMQGHAVVMLPYDPVRDAVLLVEQFRAPVHMIGDPAPWMWEAVAGMIDPGETPEQAAHREAMEEAHLTLKALEPAGRAYSSSGSSTEYLYLYVGLADLTETTRDGGLDSEGEDIRSRIVTFDSFLEMIDRQQLKDLPTISIGNWLARHRSRLRASDRQ